MTDSEGLLARATRLRPLLARYRAAGEQQRKLPEEAITALTEAGLFRAWVPRRFGGLECDLRTMLELTGHVTKGDASAGWLVMILGAGDWLTTLFPATAQQEVFGTDPNTRVCQVLSPKAVAARTDGGWLVSGGWAPASGCLHADWAMLGMTLPDDADGNAAFGLVPMRELTVKDTWFTLGMRATGSNLLLGEDVFVPEHRILRRAPALRGDVPAGGSVLCRYALVPTLITFLIAPMLAMAEQALEHVTDRSAHKGVAFTNYQRQRDSTAFQLAVADAATKIDVAQLIAHRSAAVIQRHAEAGDYPGFLARTRLRQQAAFAVRQCLAAVDGLVSAYGAAALSETDPLHAILRDIQTAARHAIANPAANAEIYGRALLGIQPNITEMI